MTSALIRFHLLRFALVVALVIVYFSSLSFEWLEIEDGSYYLRNPLFQEGAILQKLIAAWFVAPENNWIPGTWSVAIVLHQLFDFDALIFRSVSLAIHIINTLLVVELVRRFSRQQLISIFAGVLFGLHPIQVESVVWISSLKGLLSTCFALLSIHALFLDQSKRRYWISWFLFALALICKQDVIALPLILFFFLKLKGIADQWQKLIPHGLLSMTASSIAYLVNQGNTNPASPTIIVDQVVRPFSAFGHYVSKWLFPLELHPEYRLEASSSLGTIILGVVAFLVIGGFLIKLWKNSAECKLIDVSSVSVLVAILPFLGWFPSPLEFASDRLIYFSSIFFSLSSAIILGKLLNGRSIHAYCLIGFFTIILFFLTKKQTSYWKTDHSLCNLCLGHDPQHYLSRINLGLIYARNKDFVEAEKHLFQVVEQHPMRVQGWIELAKVSVVKGDIEQAKAIINQGLQRHPDNDHLERIMRGIP